jgi:hypothetical protein
MVKVVPLNIGDLLTPLGLCYWIADDGGFLQNTHRITLAEVEVLSRRAVNSPQG